MKKTLAIPVVISVFLLGFAAGTGAQNTVQTVSAYLNQTIKMTLHGEAFTPQEVNGTQIKPLIYDGRSYLPVRAIAEALNIPVDWDQATKTIKLGEEPPEFKQPQGVSMLNYRIYEQDLVSTIKPNFLSIHGHSFSKGLYCIEDEGFCIVTDIDVKYKNLAFNLGMTGPGYIEVKFKNKETNRVLDTVNIREKDKIIYHELDITNAAKLLIQVKAYDNYDVKPNLIIGDPSVY